MFYILKYKWNNHYMSNTSIQHDIYYYFIKVIVSNKIEPPHINILSY
jgi:hypothetical protein